MWDDQPDGATPLDPDQREGLKIDAVTTMGQLNELEQANILSASAWLRRQRKFPPNSTTNWSTSILSQMATDVTQGYLQTPSCKDSLENPPSVGLEKGRNTSTLCDQQTEVISHT